MIKENMVSQTHPINDRMRPVKKSVCICFRFIEDGAIVVATIDRTSDFHVLPTIFAWLTQLAVGVFCYYYYSLVRNNDADLMEKQGSVFFNSIAHKHE